MLVNTHSVNDADQSKTDHKSALSKALLWGLSAAVGTLGVFEFSALLGGGQVSAGLSMSSIAASLCAGAITGIALGLNAPSADPATNMDQKAKRTGGRPMPFQAQRGRSKPAAPGVTQTLFELEQRDPLHRKQVEDELYRYVTTDSVTHLANRRHLLNRIDEAIAQTRRDPERDIAVLTFSLHDLAHAHALAPYRATMKSLCEEEADPAITLPMDMRQSLQAITRSCSVSLRPGDMMARISGLHFAILLPSAKPRAAMACAERLSQIMQATPLAKEDRTLIPYGATFGVATLKAGESAEDLLNRCLDAEILAQHDGQSVRFASSAPPLGLANSA